MGIEETVSLEGVWRVWFYKQTVHEAGSFSLGVVMASPSQGRVYAEGFTGRLGTMGRLVLFGFDYPVPENWDFWWGFLGPGENLMVSRYLGHEWIFEGYCADYQGLRAAQRKSSALSGLSQSRSSSVVRAAMAEPHLL